MSPQRRIVMRVEVLWITEDSNSTVEAAFRHYDEVGLPSPVDLVAGAMKLTREGLDWSAPVNGTGLEVRADGPDKWSAAFDSRPRSE